MKQSLLKRLLYLYSHQNQDPRGAAEEMGANPYDSDRPSPLPAFDVVAAASPVVTLGTTKVPPTDVAIAGIVPLPVALIISASAFFSNQRMVSPSDLRPSCLVSSNSLAVETDDIRILRPRPSTFTCRSAARFFGNAISVFLDISCSPSASDDLETESDGAGKAAEISNIVGFSIERFSSFGFEGDAIHTSSSFSSVRISSRVIRLKC